MVKIRGKIDRVEVSRDNLMYRIRRFDYKKIDRDKIGLKFYEALKSPYLFLSLGLLVGLIISVQFKVESRRPLSENLFHGRLVELRGEYLSEKNELSARISEVQKDLQTKERELADKKYISGNAYGELETQELIFGNTDLVGQGIVIDLSDGELQVKDEFSKSLTHAADLRDIVNLLWYAGAEAIAINGERVIYNTSIDCIVSTIMINSNNYVSPFEIKAIGNQYDLYGVINGSRKLIDIKKRANKKQINFDVRKERGIEVPRYSGPYSDVNI